MSASLASVKRAAAQATEPEQSLKHQLVDPVDARYALLATVTQCPELARIPAPIEKQLRVRDY